MNFGTGLHDVNIAKKAALNVLTKLVDQYDFKLKESDAIEPYDVKFVSIQKNELVVSIMVSEREAYEIFFVKKNESETTKRTMRTYIKKKFGRFTPESKKYNSDHFNSANGLKEKSQEQYQKLMEYEINFMIDNFSEMFEKGVLVE